MARGFVSDPGDDGIGLTTPGHYGAAATGVTLAETTIAAAWNVQGDATRTAFTDEVLRQFGVALPTEPNTTAHTAELTALWLGPTSWLLVASAAPSLSRLAAKRDALNVAGGALFDVSASRVAWTVAGTHAATVLAKGCPLDFHLRAFAEGTCAQSLLGHIGALFHRRDRAPSFTVLVARSFARDAWHALCVSAAQHGYEVLPARPW